jgi:hypothetical protein
MILVHVAAAKNTRTATARWKTTHDSHQVTIKEHNKENNYK